MNENIRWVAIMGDEEGTAHVVTFIAGNIIAAYDIMGKYGDRIKGIARVDESAESEELFTINAEIAVKESK